LNFHPLNGTTCHGDTSGVRDNPGGQSPYQLFNMAGNVWEWVADFYKADYYANSPSINPQGPENGGAKVLRGGAWYYDADFARTTYRYRQDPLYYYAFTGFRCVQPE
jgi:formylglycine-generating enzyme required for sulfatase activity